jgi:hypothetical protein
MADAITSPPPDARLRFLSFFDFGDMAFCCARLAFNLFATDIGRMGDVMLFCAVELMSDKV